MQPPYPFAPDSDRLPHKRRPGYRRAEVEGVVVRAGRIVTAVGLVLAIAGCGGDDDEVSENEPAATTEAPAAVPAPLGEATEPVVVGHRGASAHFPDNSLEGFRGAADLGADWVELDVRLSSDQVAVLSHDPETAAGTVVGDATAADLEAEGIATLADGLELIGELGMGVDVELKAIPTEEDYDPSLALVDEAMAVVDEVSLPGPVLVSSFNLGAIDRARELTNDEVDTVLIVSQANNADLATNLVAGGHDGVAVGDADLASTVIDQFAAEGLTTWVWTVNDPEAAARLVADGAEAIITDEPDTISEALAG